jgi:hypothetical protein
MSHTCALGVGGRVIGTQLAALLKNPAATRLFRALPQMLLHIRHPEHDLGRSAFLAGYAHAPFERRLLTSACHVGVLGLVNAPALAGTVD